VLDRVCRSVGTLAPLLALLLLGCSDAHEAVYVPERVYPAQDPTGKHSDRLPNIQLRTQDDQLVHFYDDLIRDRSVFINFMYTTCPLICPGTTANLVKVHALLGDRMGEDILMLSISLDPETDTPEQLKHYAGLFGDKKGWLYLTGDYEEIDLLRHKLGVYDPDPIIDADKTQHSGIITFGNDRTDRWAALPALMKADEIVETFHRVTGTGDARYRWKRPQNRASRLYPARGVVRSVHRAESRVVIDHEDIPGLMKAMTMGFEVPDRALLEGLGPGQGVEFEVEFAQGRYRIVALRTRTN